MKTQLLILIAVLAFASCDLERIEDGNNPGTGNCDQPAQFTFETSFGGGILDSATAVVKTAEGEYFITGFTKKQGERMLLYKTNLCGDTLLYLASGDNFSMSSGNAVCTSWAGGVVAAGTQESFVGNKAYLQQVSDGGIITDSYNDTYDKGLNINDINPYGTDSYVTGGSIVTEGQFSDVSQSFIMIMDAGLNPSQQVEFNTSYSSRLNAAVPVTDNRIVGIGNVWIGFGNRIHLCTTNSFGTELQNLFTNLRWYRRG